MAVSPESPRGAMNFHYLQRVKVYHLNDEGKWDDRGTGHVAVEYVEQSDMVGLVVFDERSNGTLLVHHISSDDIYRRQEDTIIAWRDRQIATEVALSFQEAMGCSFIWDQICSMQRSIHLPSVSAIDVGPQQVDEMECHGTSQENDDIFYEGRSSAMTELPQPEQSTLPLILKIVTEGHIGNHIRVADLIVQDHQVLARKVKKGISDKCSSFKEKKSQAFLHKLLNLFHICEEVMDINGLHLIFKIMKGIISLNNSQIFEMIFSDEYIMDVVGVLEYDSELPCRQEHRLFLNNQVMFKEAMPIRDLSVLSKIHQTYRIGYIKDVILPRVLDESMSGTINTIMHANNAAVISSLKDDSAFIHEMFKRLKDPNRSDQEKEDLIRFLQEFCSLSKNLQLVHQMRLFRTLVNEGLFEVITDALQSQDESLRFRGTEILIAITNQDPSLPCQFVLQQEGHTLLALLVKGISTDLGGEQDAQFLEVIRMLLDPYTMAPSQRDGIIEIFYDKYVDQLIDIITSACPANGCTQLGGKSAYFVGGATAYDRTPGFLLNICDILCFCVLHHTHKIKHYFLRNNVIGKVLCLTRRNEKFLVASAVRFLRAVISQNDDFLHCHIVKNDLFEPVISAFMANGNRYNLLNSTVLELMEYIRKEKFLSLIAYLVENYSHQLEQIDYVDTFHQLKQIYEQSLEEQPPSDVSGGIKDHGGFPSDWFNQTNDVIEQRKRNDDDHSLGREREDYFNEESDDEEDSKSAQIVIAAGQHAHAVVENGNVLDSSSARVGAVGLIDYAEEDGDSSVQISGFQGPECVNSEKTISFLPINDSMSHGMGHPPKAKRRISTGDSNDNKQETPQKRRLHINAKDHVASVAARNKVEQNEDYVGSNHDTGFQDNMAVDIYVGVERSTEERVSLASTDPNGHENSIMEGRYGSGNDESPSISKQGSECDTPGIGVEENSKRDKPNEDGPSNACIQPVVKESPQSPVPNSVQ